MVGLEQTDKQAYLGRAKSFLGALNNADDAASEFPGFHVLVQKCFLLLDISFI